jgi:branched-chain amino acid transport system ATP-binding protein
MLRVRELEAFYGASQALFGMELGIDAGEVVTLMGRNGMGKTTTVSAIMGLLPARRGTVEFEGQRVEGLPSFRIARLGLGLVPEGRQIFPNLSVRENLELGSYRRGGAGRARNLERVFGIFPRLQERHTQRAGTLSGGEQQMLAIGRGLMAEPVLLILDEPSLGLSPLLVEEMFALIRTLNADGLAVLLVEQNVMQSLQIANRAYVLENGQVVMQGDAKTLAADPALERAYLGM